MATTRDGHDLLINDECVVTVLDENIECIYKGSWIQYNELETQVMCRFEHIDGINKKFDLLEYEVKHIVIKDVSNG